MLNYKALDTEEERKTQADFMFERFLSKKIIPDDVSTNLFFHNGAVLPFVWYGFVISIAVFWYIFSFFRLKLC